MKEELKDSIGCLIDELVTEFQRAGKIEEDEVSDAYKRVIEICKTHSSSMTCQSYIG